MESGRQAPADLGNADDALPVDMWDNDQGQGCLPVHSVLSRRHLLQRDDWLAWSVRKKVIKDAGQLAASETVTLHFCRPRLPSKRPGAGTFQMPEQSSVALP
jgi:hypothetical protein